MKLDNDSLSPAAHTNDGFFKAIFSQPEHATAFFKSHLPAEVTEKIEWSTLVVLPGSFIKSSLQQVHTDLLFSVRIGARETLLYLLFEHQSSPDPTMPLRLLGYLTEIFNQHYQNHGFPLPPVLPFVFHQGPESWNISTAFEDLFKLPPEVSSSLLPFLPKFSYALLDLTRFDPATGENDSHLRAIILLMKLARQKELLGFFQWLANYSAADLPDHLLGRMLLYALHTDSNLDAEQIYHTLSTNPELEKNAMSVAEKLRAEGRLEGQEKGRLEGQEKGLWIGKIQLLEEFLNSSVSSRETLSPISLEELQARYHKLHLAYESRFKR